MESSRTIAIWRPFAEFSRYVRAVLGARDGNINHEGPTATAASPACVSEPFDAPSPNAIDVHYFDSELRIAFMCLLVAKSGPLDKSHGCAARAVELYCSLRDWVQANGGHAPFEQRLTRLRWQLDALPHVEIPDEPPR